MTEGAIAGAIEDEIAPAPADGIGIVSAIWNAPVRAGES